MMGVRATGRQSFMQETLGVFCIGKMDVLKHWGTTDGKGEVRNVLQIPEFRIYMLLHTFKLKRISAVTFLRSRLCLQKKRTWNV